MNNFGNDNRKQLEEQFKNRFENAQFIPPAHLWEQIDTALNEKPWYKRPLFYWTSGLVAALLLVVMFWFTLAYDNSVAISNSMVADKYNVENSIQYSKKNNKTTKITSKDTRTVRTPNDTELNSVKINPVPKEKILSTSDSDISPSNSQASTSSNSTKNLVNTGKDNSDARIAVVLNLNRKDKNEDLKANTTNSNTVSTKTANRVAIIPIKKLALHDYFLLVNPYIDTEIIIEQDSTKDAIANNQNSQNPKDVVRNSSGIAITFGINHTQGIYKPSFRTDSLYSGLAVIEAYSSNLADTLPKMNLSGTYQQTGFDIALAFGKNKRWSLNTGLGMGKANYSFGSSNTIRFRGSNDSLTPNDQLPLTQLPVNQVEVNYEWIQIPIAIGYQFGESRAKKFSGFAQLGTAIELLSSHSYTSTDPQFTYALGSHRTTNTQFWTQAGINYHITNRFVIWGGGTYKSSLSSLINENGVTFSSQSYGWQVGTRFTIFKSKK